ncbi:OLC1v1013466C1 [Oldenlandia corymbosa var. corymbosa]|uniref:OLC1v1013466C1 n=1 Tax=Oldenlandia corymbosa var. corymbosa TaxID=529605 RepID=A0AAV1E0F7_OLDCO|nr:OLC1v1013466C1 [Oldenlandia corymbosa var. corymbosa]
MSIRTENPVLGEDEVVGFWSEFPEDVIVEILCRLPAEDLIALKSVSKDWNFVISRFCIPKLCPPHPCAPFWGFICFEEPLPPSFFQEGHECSLDKYLEHHFISLCRFRKGKFLRRLAGNGLKMERRISALLQEVKEGEHDASDIRDCCNGLLLLASNSQYYVANPVTKQRFWVPKSSRQHHNIDLKTIHSSLVFDPSVSLSFKIVSCICPAVDATPSRPMELDVFCSKTGEWYSHVLPLEPHSLYGFEWLRRSVYFKQALYSLSLAMYLVCIDNLFPRSGTSINKDCGSELEAWAIELPDKDLMPKELLPHSCGCIGFSSACFYYSNRDVEGSSMLVWMLVLKGKSSEWILIHTISIADDLVNGFGSFERAKHWKKFDCFRPRAFFSNDDAIVVAAPKLLITYYIKIKMIDECHVPGLYRCNRDALHLDGHCILPFSPCLLLFNTIAKENLRE